MTPILMMSLLSQKIQRIQRSMRALAKQAKKLETRFAAAQTQRSEREDQKKIEALKQKIGS